MAHKDFDKFFNEMNKKSPITITLYGRDWELPADLPASTMLVAIDSAKEGNTELTHAKQMELAMDMLGRSNVEEWCKNGMTMPQIESIMTWVQGQHNPKVEKHGKGKGKGKK